LVSRAFGLVQISYQTLCGMGPVCTQCFLLKRLSTLGHRYPSITERYSISVTFTKADQNHFLQCFFYSHKRSWCSSVEDGFKQDLVIDLANEGIISGVASRRDDTVTAFTLSYRKNNDGSWSFYKEDGIVKVCGRFIWAAIMNKTGLQLLNARTHSMTNSAWNYIAFPLSSPSAFSLPLPTPSRNIVTMPKLSFPLSTPCSIEGADDRDVLSVKCECTSRHQLWWMPA
jgi:hypothetical protein